MPYILYEMIHYLLSKSLIKDWVLLLGRGRTTWQNKKTQIDNKKVYQELRGDVEGPLEKIIKKVIWKFINRSKISHETLDYFSANNPKLVNFICSLRSINSFLMYQGDLLFQTWEFIHKTCLPSLSIILSLLPKTLSCALKIQIISYVSWLTFLLCQTMQYYLLNMLGVYILIYCMMRGI